MNSFEPAVRVVTFDAGSTLIEPWPPVGQVYAEVAARHGSGDWPAEDLGRRFRDAFQAHGKAVNTMADWARIVDETFAGLTPVLPSRTFFPELYEWFAHSRAWRVFDDVLPTLAALTGRGTRLGLISNWDDRLRPLLAELGLADRFEQIVISCEVGKAKPERAIFEAAVARFGVNPGEMLHVGDSREADLLGARQAGLQAVQIVRGGRMPGDGQIGSLVELLARV